MVIVLTTSVASAVGRGGGATTVDGVFSAFQAKTSSALFIYTYGKSSIIIMRQIRVYLT